MTICANLPVIFAVRCYLPIASRARDAMAALDAITLAPTLAVLALAALAYLAYLWTSPKAFCAGEVTAIYIYPLKSARGISVKSATLDERGLEFDRLWMAVDDDGTFLSQRRRP